MITSFVDQRTETQKLMFRIFDFELVKMANVVFNFSISNAKVIEIFEKIESNEPNNDDFAKLSKIAHSTKKCKYYLDSKSQSSLFVPKFWPLTTFHQQWNVMMIKLCIVSPKINDSDLLGEKCLVKLKWRGGYTYYWTPTRWFSEHFLSLHKKYAEVVFTSRKRRGAS